MASAVLFGRHTVALAPHVPPQTTVSVASMGPTGLRVQRRPINLPSRSFTKVPATIVAQTPGYSSWKSVADAQKIAEALGVLKSSNNLRRLEEISTDFSSKRSDTPPPAKRQRTRSPPLPKSDDAVSLGEDDRISLDWGSDLEDATRIVDLATGQDLDIFTGYVSHTHRQMMMTNEFSPKPLNAKELKLLFNINMNVAIEYIAINKHHLSTLYCAKCEDTTTTPWLLDSGASMHITFCYHHLFFFKPFLFRLGLHTPFPRLDSDSHGTPNSL